MKTRLLILLWVLVATPFAALAQITVWPYSSESIIFPSYSSNDYAVTNGRCPSESGTIKLGTGVSSVDGLAYIDLEFAAFPAGTNVTGNPTPSGSGWDVGTGSLDYPKVTGLAAGNYDLYVRYKNNSYSLDQTNWEVVATNIAVTTSNGTLTGNQPTKTDATCGNSDGSVIVSGITRNNYTGSGTLYAGLYDVNNNLVVGKSGAVSGGAITFSGIAAGTYTVRAWDDAIFGVSAPSTTNQVGCHFAIGSSVTVGTNVGFTVNKTPAATTCAGNDGSVVVSVTPSGTYYFFDGTNWQTMTNDSYTLTGLSAADYTSSSYAVSLYSNGSGSCPNVDVDFTISAGSNVPFSVEATPTHPTCPGGTGSVSVSITPAGTYYIEYPANSNTWNLVPLNPVTVPNVPSGTFSARISTSSTGANCIQTASTTVNAAPATITATATGGTGTITMTNPSGGTGTFTYSASTGSTPGTFSASPLTGLAVGTYNVWAKDANNCQNQVATGVVVGGTGRSGSAATIALRVYPNPSNGNITISAANLKTTGVDLQVVDLLGKTVQKMQVTTNGGLLEQSLSLTQAGIYFVKVTDGTQTYVQKVVVE